MFVGGFHVLLGLQTTHTPKNLRVLFHYVFVITSCVVVGLFVICHLRHSLRNLYVLFVVSLRVSLFVSFASTCVIYVVVGVCNPYVVAMGGVLQTTTITKQTTHETPKNFILGNFLGVVVCRRFLHLCRLCNHVSLFAIDTT